MVKYRSQELDAVFAALADPTRRKILERLSAGNVRATDLAKPFSISLPAVSKHLRVLEEAGLLCRRRSGREHRFDLKPAPFRAASEWIEQYRKFWEGSLDALAEYLENEEKQQTK